MCNLFLYPKKIIHKKYPMIYKLDHQHLNQIDEYIKAKKIQKQC